MRRLTFILLVLSFAFIPVTVHAKDDPQVEKALRLLLSGQKEQGMSAFRNLAEAGNVEAELFLGRMNARPNGLTQQPDPAEALKWFTKASAQGSGEASAEIADLYDRGFGVEKSETEVAKWLELAATQGWDQQEVDLICYSRTPGSQPLTCEPISNTDSCPSGGELGVLRAAGVTGVIKPTGGIAPARLGPKARALVVLDHKITSEVRLKQPRHTNAIYVQREDGWTLLPDDAQLLDRPIILSPQPDTPRWYYLLAGVQDVDGSVTSGGCAVYKTAPPQ